MKRSVSQAAKVLGVDGALLKCWALLFKDYLGSDANPPKGKPRSFGDGDVLVLLYVGSQWEEDNPDIECIKIGLNMEEHHEDRFHEQLYWHTPLLQELPDDLDETWRHGILICGVGGRHGCLELARNYRNVAESMLETALERNELYDWVYPVLFCYRHTLELYLKMIGEIDEPTHSLARCVHLVETRFGKKLRIPVRAWILQLEEIDPAGTAFRYADEAPGSMRYGEYWFDTLHFKFAMRHVFDEIDSAILHVGAAGRAASKKI